MNIRVTKAITKTAVTASVLSITLMTSSAIADTNKYVGSGSSFIYPIMSVWAKGYSQQTDNVQIDYQSKGSSAGVRDLISGVVDFAVSDAAMNTKEQQKVPGGVIFLPVTAGEIVLSYNLKGVQNLKLSRDAYTEIFSGKVTKWNDPVIAKSNPDVKLPDRSITVVTRSDGSGSTFALTNHFSAVSPEWKETIGTGKKVQWPQQSNFVGAPRNDGVAATVMQTLGAIGYIEYGYAQITRQPMAQLENVDGNFVAPNAKTGAAALANVNWPENLVAFAADPKGADAYPITTFTWMMIRKEALKEGSSAELQKFVNYILNEGQASAEKMGYIPVPQNLKQKMTDAIALAK
ncbi:phosphate ABC transporter substrate-binding protein PstS [Vibrio sp. SS-MA-C1-2]|uniref:phosphate ABC transporter substrate-binding protein PstS n=1 Tax=Vibrio sp. SS-MA-C1-2 TaxID=2908646 RepID=UPI001F1D17A2|nr:phosphate ABC transporter substrate-binding protein PstS [Vibrio sp. SS-MA-C1-2]UJF17413.1 phosphate ABC transporter substrate-binding protein PstS [Vibrio sp. SS-MA-C1-2]